MPMNYTHTFMCPALLFQVTDPDSGPAEVTVSLAAASQKAAHFETPEKKSSFTLEELKKREVFLVVDKEGESDLGLTVSDGRDVGNSVVLRVETFVLQIFAVNNTGLVVAAGSSALLTSYNLTFTTNAPDQSLNLR